RRGRRRPRGSGARPGREDRRDARRPHRRRHDRGDRRAPRHECTPCRRRRRARARTRVRRPARPPAHARSRGRGDDRERDGGRGRRRLLRDSRDAEHRPDRRFGGDARRARRGGGPSLSRGGHVHEGAVAAELGFTGYPSIAESVMVERDLSLAEYERQPLHLLHLSSVESVDALRRARDAGVAASGEVTPHHLVLTDEAVRSLDPNMKMNPPLRGELDRTALLGALQDGTIEAIATDHAPHALHEKEVPFEAAPFGVTGLETAFAALHTYLVRPGVVRLETLLERMSAGAARAYGLHEPAIEVGEPANLVLLDLNASYRITESTFRSRSVNSWLLGATVKGAVRTTIAAGRVVFGA